MRGFVAGGGGVSSESGWVRLGCLRVGGSGRGHWRFADGGGDISVAGRAFLDLLLRFDGARGARGGHSLGGRGGDGRTACVSVPSSWICSCMVTRGLDNVWDCDSDVGRSVSERKLSSNLS